MRVPADPPMLHARGEEWAEVPAEQARGTFAPTPLDAVKVRPLSIVPEGEEFLVGDPERLEYVLLPEVGVRVIRLLQAGSTVSAAAAAIGADVDVPDFVATLAELGFVSPARAAHGEENPVPSGRRGMRRVPPRVVRPLFGRPAWGVYAGCAALAGAILTTQRNLIPMAQDIFFLPSPLTSVACLTLLMYALALIHEVWHWAAARAEGLDARITVSRRLYFLVLETDLSQLWSLPRRRRYSALLAGMAFDAVVLSDTLVARLGDANGWWHLEHGVIRLLAAVTFIEVTAIAAQFYVFTRTDVYAVLITATGCVNLWRINQLRLLSKVRQLNTEQRRELEEAHSRDVAVARWYAWVYAVGIALACAFFLVYFLPATLQLVGWLTRTVGAARVTTPTFWAALLFAAIVLSPYALTGAIAVRDLLRRRPRDRGPRRFRHRSVHGAA